MSRATLAILGFWLIVLAAVAARAALHDRIVFHPVERSGAAAVAPSWPASAGVRLVMASR